MATNINPSNNSVIGVKLHSNGKRFLSVRKFDGKYWAEVEIELTEERFNELIDLLGIAVKYSEKCKSRGLLFDGFERRDN